MELACDWISITPVFARAEGAEGRRGACGGGSVDGCRAIDVSPWNYPVPSSQQTAMFKTLKKIVFWDHCHAPSQAVCCLMSDLG
jgi:hypothetical protein